MHLKLHSSTIHTHQIYGYRWQIFVQGELFADPVKLWWCITAFVEPVNKINSMCTVPNCSQWLSQPILWIVSVSVTCWRLRTVACVLMEIITYLWMPTLSRVYNVAICIKVLQMLQITCRFGFGILLYMQLMTLK